MTDPALAELLPLAPSYVTAPEVTYDLAHTDRVPDRTIPRMKALFEIANCNLKLWAKPYVAKGRQIMS
jgi:hypothetical protein